MSAQACSGGSHNQMPLLLPDLDRMGDTFLTSHVVGSVGVQAPDQIGGAQSTASLLPGAAADASAPSIEAAEGSFQVDHQALASLHRAGEAAAAVAAISTDTDKQQQQYQPPPKEDGATRQEPRKDKGRKRGTRERHSEADHGGAAAASGGEVAKKPTLADLARQLQSGGASANTDSGAATGQPIAGQRARPASQNFGQGDMDGSQEIVGAIVGHQGQAGTVAVQQIGDRFTGERLEHINLFAEEEKKARNPEVEVSCLA